MQCSCEITPLSPHQSFLLPSSPPYGSFLPAHKHADAICIPATAPLLCMHPCLIFLLSGFCQWLHQNCFCHKHQWPPDTSLTWPISSFLLSLWSFQNRPLFWLSWGLTPAQSAMLAPSLLSDLMMWECPRDQLLRLLIFSLHTNSLGDLIQGQYHPFADGFQMYSSNPHLFRSSYIKIPTYYLLFDV